MAQTVLQNGDDYTYSYGVRFSVRDSDTANLEIENEQVVHITGDIYFKRTHNSKQHLIEGYCLLGKYIHMSGLEEDALFEHLENDIIDNIVGVNKHMLLQSACVVPDPEEPYHSTFKVVYFYNCGLRCFAVNDFSERAQSKCCYCLLQEAQSVVTSKQARLLPITKEELKDAGVKVINTTPVGKALTELRSPPPIPFKKPTRSKVAKLKAADCSTRKLRFSPYACSESSANAEFKLEEGDSQEL